MADELTIDSQIYISSKRASQISGYEQDYIGQLCRAGSIKSHRVGGLWYVLEDSLMKYKAGADEYKPVPPINNSDIAKPDSLVSFDGKGYVSTSRAAKLTGYTPDYVGQMARAGIIASKQVGNRWYVEQEAILKHKESKDALLAAVQVESVGLKSPRVDNEKAYSGSFMPSEPLLQYTSDNRELMPAIASVSKINHEDEANNDLHTIPIRVRHDRVEMPRKPAQYTPAAIEPRRSMLPMLLPVGALTVVIVLSFGFFSLKKSSIYTENNIKSPKASQLASAGITIADRIADYLEPFVTTELVYRRD